MPLTLLSNFWADVHDIQVLWQIAVVALCLLLSYVLSKLLRLRFPIDPNLSVSESKVAHTFFSIMAPSFAWAFLLLGKLVLIRFHHVHLLSLLIPIFGSLALIRFGIFLSRRIFSNKSEIGAIHLLIEQIFSWAVWLTAILFYTGLLNDVLDFMDGNVISFGHTKLSLWEIVQALVSVVLTVLLALWAGASLENRLMKVNSIHSSLRMVLSRLGRGLLILFAVLVSLWLVGIDLTVLSVFGGALGVGLGLGLQKIASNYVSGFIILLDRSLSIDDLISVDKYNGKVSKINSRYTVLKGLDGVESIIPNEMLISSPVQNLSLTDRAIWMSTDVAVAYDTDIEVLLPQLEESVKTVDRVSKVLKTSANLVNFGQYGLELRIGFWIIDPENGKLGVLSQVNLAIWKLLQEKAIQVPYPQHEIRMLNSETK